MKLFKKVIAVGLAVSLVTTSMGYAASPSTKAVTPVAKPVAAEMLASTNQNCHNYIKMKIIEGKLHVEGATTLPADKFSFNVRKAGTTQSQWTQDVRKPGEYGFYFYEKRDGYTFFDVELNDEKIETDGDYVLVIMRTKGNTKSVLYNNGVFTKTGDVYSIAQYNSIIENNQNRHKKVNNNPAAYKNVYMTDLQKYLFRRPGVGPHQKVTKAQVAYFKRVSNKIVGKSTSPYWKARKIYQYAARNLYYDNVAYATGKKQYYNPYDLISHIENKKNSAYSYKGKVATVCIGYAGVVATLARAQGIPARIVKGHHLALNKYYHTWNTEPKNVVNKTDHWWVELYINGKWHMVDANAGAGNRYNKNAKTNKWTYTGLRNYTFFMPSDEQIATNFAIHEILGGRK